MDYSLSPLFLYAIALSFLQFTLAVPSSSVCALESEVFRCGIESKCPLWMSLNPSVEVDGNFLDRVMSSKRRNDYTSVLFYASWCPFSHTVRPKFDTLSLMFPRIEHLAVEQSYALPSVFSRFGIHSLPSILVVNQTSKVRYHGPKDLPSLIEFYKQSTGLKPVQYLYEEEPISFGSSGNIFVQLWQGSSIKETLKLESYLVFAVLFLCLRMIIFIFPQMLSCLKVFWALYLPHLNLGIFGETSQLFGRTLHMIDVRRIWAKFRLCKTRSFHERAKNARVWASSLASVSLGESSSARSS